MVAEKSLLFPSLPSATLIYRLNKSFGSILSSRPFDVVPAASNTGGIQTAGSQKGWNSPSQEPQIAMGRPGSASSQDQRYTHTEYFCFLALQCGGTWRVFMRGQDCWRAQQGGGRGLQTVLQRDWSFVHGRAAAGRNNSSMCPLALGKWVLRLKPKPLITP